MKTNRSLPILAGGLAMLIVGTFLIWRFCQSANSPETFGSGNSAAVTNQSMPATAIIDALAGQQTNVTAQLPDEAGGFFKTIIDQ